MLVHRQLFNCQKKNKKIIYANVHFYFCLQGVHSVRGVSRGFPGISEGAPGCPRPVPSFTGSGSGDWWVVWGEGLTAFPKLIPTLRRPLKICNYISVLLAEITEDLSKQRWIRWFFCTKTELIVFSVTLALHYQDIIVFNSIPMMLNESPCNAIRTKIYVSKEFTIR